MPSWDSIPPTDKQLRYAMLIKTALNDNVDLSTMDKWEISDYISSSLKNEEKAWEIDRFFVKARYRKNIKFGKSYDGYSDEYLNANYGLDACDFGIYPWGNS